MTKNARLVVLGLLAFGVSVVTASAQPAPKTCASGGYTGLVPDGRTTTYSAAAGTLYRFVMGTNASAGGQPRSFSVEVRDVADQFNSASLYLKGDGFFNCTATTEGVTFNDTSQVYEPRMVCEGCSAAPKRYSFTTTSRLVIALAQFSAAATIEVEAAETTMFSPAWSTNGTYATFYSFYNNTSSPVTATLVLTTSAGASGGTTVLVIAPFTTAATNTTALGAPANKTGTARLTHDGPPGALTAAAAIANFTTTPAYIQVLGFDAAREVR